MHKRKYNENITGHKMLRKNDERGFTIVEVIAVLVILSILAAIALPKYIDLQEQAKLKALEGALAEGMSTVSMSYAYLMLSNGGTAATSTIAAKAANNTPVSNDFSYTFTAAATGVDVKVKAITTGALGNYPGEKTKTWLKP